MVRSKNYIIALLGALFLATFSTVSFGMETPEDQAQEVVSYPKLLINKAKDVSVVMMEGVLNHPKLAITAGVALCGIVAYRRWFATQQDHEAMDKRLTKYRLARRKSVEDVRRAHHKDTQEKLQKLNGLQEELAVKLTTADNELDAVGVSCDDLFTRLQQSGLHQTVAFTAIQAAIRQSAQVAQAQGKGLQQMQDVAAGIVAEQGGTQQRVVALRVDLGSANAILARMIEAFRQNGDDVEVIEQRVRELLAQGARVQALEDGEIDQ